MDAEGREKNRIQLTVIRGDQWAARTVRDFDLERWLDRENHATWCKAVGEDGTVPSDGIYDIRRDRQHPWRIEARREREAVLAGVEEAVFEELDFNARRYRERIRELRRQGLIRVAVMPKTRKAA
jgi:hypothetical protein